MSHIKELTDRANDLYFIARSMFSKADRMDRNQGPSWDAERIRDEARAHQKHSDDIMVVVEALTDGRLLVEPDSDPRSIT